MPNILLGSSELNLSNDCQKTFDPALCGISHGRRLVHFLQQSLHKLPVIQGSRPHGPSQLSVAIKTGCSHRHTTDKKTLTLKLELHCSQCLSTGGPVPGGYFLLQIVGSQHYTLTKGGPHLRISLFNDLSNGLKMKAFTANTVVHICQLTEICVSGKNTTLKKKEENDRKRKGNKKKKRKKIRTWLGSNQQPFG